MTERIRGREESNPIKVGETLLHRYRIVRPLGQGGMGAVYLVQDELSAGRELALKVIHAHHANPEFLDAFRQEFAALAELRHPHLVRVHDFGVFDHREGGERRLYFTMDLVRGRDLLVATRGAPLSEIYPLVMQVCHGLEYIHARGIVHHDIKSENLLVTTSQADAPPTVKIMDFGLALRITDDPKPGLRGTLHYLAPETLARGFADPRSDLYALGVTLYRVFTGRFPFDATDDLTLMRAHCFDPPPAPSALRPDLPAALERIILRLLAKDPADRYASANEIIVDFNGFTGGDFPLETHATQLGWIHTGRLVGRGTALSRLREAIDERVLAPPPVAGPKTPTLLVLEGEAGMGKTRLLREARLYTQLGAAQWCAGAAATGGAAYGALVPVLRQVIAAFLAAAPAAARSALSQYGPELVKLLPELAADHALALSAGLGGAAERARLRDALVSFPIAAAQHVAMVVAIEDAHTLDDGTLEWIADTGQRLAEGRADPSPRMVVFTSVRSGEASETLRARVADWTTRGWCQGIALEALTDEQVAQFIASMLPVADREATLVTRVAAQAGGNPLFIEELMKAVVEAGCLVHRDGRWRVDARRLATVATPAQVEDLLRAGLARLSPAALDLVRALAVIDAPADVALLAMASGATIPEAQRRLADLARQRLVQRLDGGAYRIAQPQLREVVYRDLLPPERARLHRAILAELERRVGPLAGALHGPDIEAFAHHALQGADPHTAVRLAVPAARRCRQMYFNVRALELARRALPLAQQVDPEAELELRGLCIAVQRIQGDIEAARGAAEALRTRAVETGSQRAQARAHLALGGTFADTGDHETAHRHYLEAWTLADGIKDHVTSLETLRELGRGHLLRGAPQEALKVFADVLARIRPGDDARQQAVCHNDIGSVHLSLRAFDLARLYFAAARRGFEALGDACGRAAVLHNLAGMAFDQGRCAEALQDFTEALQGLRAVGYRAGVAVLLENLGRVHARQGAYGEALDDYRESLNIRREIGDTAGKAQCLKEIGLIARNRGDFVGARGHYEEALALEEPLGHAGGRATTLHYLGGLLMELGEYASALTAHRDGLALCQERQLGPLAIVARFGLAECLFNLGQLDASEQELAACHGILRETPFPEAMAAVTGLSGALSLARGRAAQATDLLWEAAETVAGRDGDAQTRMFIDAHLAEALLAAPGPADPPVPPRDGRVVVARLAGLAQVHGARPFVAEALRLEGLYDLAAGRTAGALERVIAAWTEARELTAPELHWRVQHALGCVFQRVGRRRDAAHAFIQAYDVIERLWQALPAQWQPAYLTLPARARVCQDAKALMEQLGIEQLGG